MAIRDDDFDERDFAATTGDDSPPLMSRVPEPPPSHWGRMTSQARTLSPQYLRFATTHKRKETRDGTERTG